MALVFAGIAGRFPLGGGRARSVRVDQRSRRCPAGTVGLDLVHGRRPESARHIVMLQEHATTQEDTTPTLAARSGHETVVCGLVRGPSSYAAWRKKIEDLAHGFELRVAEALAELRGEFVLAHATEDGGRVVLLRSVGCPYPVFYRQTSDALLWATNPLFLLPGGRPGVTDVDTELLPSLLLRLRPAAGSSYFRGMRSLPPGWMLEASGRGVQARQVDDFHIRPPRRISFSQAATELRVLTSDAVRTALPGSGARVMALSGGVDSSIVCFEAMSEPAIETRAVHWTYGTAQGRGSETEAARSVAAQLNVKLTEVSPSSARTGNGEYLDCHADCFLPHNLLGPESALAHAAGGGSEEVSLLSGAYADQLFEGDSLNRMSLNPLSEGSFWRLIPVIARQVRRNPADRRLLARSLAGLLNPCRGLVPRHYARTERIGTWLSDTARADALRQVTTSFDQRLAQYEAQTNLLARNRSAAMAYISLKDSIDCEQNYHMVADVMFPRGVVPVFPLLDRPLVEFSLSLPAKHKAGMYLDEIVTKQVWRYAYADVLPVDTVARSMEPALAIMADEYASRNRQRIEQLLTQDSILADLGIVNTAELRATLADSRRQSLEAGPLLDACVVELWLRRLGRQNTGEEGTDDHDHGN
jgi:asparagine synthetase B (glutamine-hydrolysing)